MHRLNSVLRWSRGTQQDGAAVTFMGYANKWYSTDQIPSRAVIAGLQSLWGTMDPTDGGDTIALLALVAAGARLRAITPRASKPMSSIRPSISTTTYTYFLAHQNLGRPVPPVRSAHHGRRQRRSMRSDGTVYGAPVETRIGLQGRYDDIRLGLQDSFRRTPYDTVRNDAVGEGSIGVWTDTTVRWTPWLSTVTGGRFDYYNATVNSLQSLLDAPETRDQRGSAGLPSDGTVQQDVKDASLFSPKASIIVGPFHKTEFYFNYGEGFHSTDARGAVQSFSTSELSDTDGFASRSRSIPLLVKSRGAEIGARTKFIEGLDSSISFFWLNLEFGEPVRRRQRHDDLRPSQSPLRHRIRQSYIARVSWISFDGDVALVHARYRGVDRSCRRFAWLDLLTPEALPYGTFFGNAPGNYLSKLHRSDGDGRT